MNVSMVKKTVLGAAGSIALLVAAASAHATPVPITVSGTLILTGPPIIDCLVTLTGTVDDMTGDVVVTGGMVEPPVAACTAIVLTGFPWIGKISGGEVDLSTPHATIPGVVDCEGTIAGVEVVGAPIPSSFILDDLEFGNCRIEGTLSSI